MIGLTGWQWGRSGYCRAGWILAACLLAALPSLLRAEDSQLTEPDPAVQAGRDALSSQWGLPWYDETTDDFSPVQLRVPNPPSPFWDWLKSLFSGWNMDLGNVLQFLGWMLVAGLVIWLVVALIRAYQAAESLAADQTAQQLAAENHVQRIEALPIAFEAPEGDYLGAARRAHDQGDLTAAVVYLFSHQLLALDRHAMLQLVKGKTNRQYLRELRSHAAPGGQLAAILHRTIGLFEAAFFGAHPPAPEAFDQCWQEASEFDRLLSPGEEAK